LEHVTLFYYIASEEKLTRSGSEEKLTRSGSEEKLTRSGQPKRPFVCQVYGITSVTVATTQPRKEVMSPVPVYLRVRERDASKFW